MRPPAATLAFGRFRLPTGQRQENGRADLAAGTRYSTDLLIFFLYRMLVLLYHDANYAASGVLRDARCPVRNFR
jgi:hypothetical protein